MNPPLPRPDFLRPLPGAGALAWAVCATGLLVLAVAGLDGYGAWSDRQQSEDRLAAVQRGGRAAPPTARVATNAPANRAAVPSAAAARQAEARRWLARLAHPWPEVWAASEAASVAGIAWLGLEHGEQGTLRLTGLAADATQAQAAAQALREQTRGGAPLWPSVLLARVERVAEGQRFEIAAELASPAVVAVTAATPGAPVGVATGAQP